MVFNINSDKKIRFRLPGAASLGVAVLLLVVLSFSAGCGPQQKIDRSRKADSLGFQLTSPRRGNFAAESVFEIKGTVELPEEVNYLMVSVAGNGQTSKQFVRAEGSVFSGRVYLPFGKGTYEVSILAADSADTEWFESLAAFEVYNGNSETISFPEYSQVMFRKGIRFTAEPAGSVPGKFELAGEIKDYEENTAVLIRSQKAGENEKYDQFARIQGGRFRAAVYLPGGPGKYRVDVMVPKQGSENIYLGVAGYEVENTAETVFEPVQYYQGYFRRGLLLDDFLRPGINTDNRLVLEGSFVPELYEKYRAENTGLYIETKKIGPGAETAHDWVGVAEGRFKGNIWLRFGPGEYEVSIGLPSSDGSHDITFVAKFRVANTGTDNIRDLAPGRGIESDHPDIMRLSRQLTKGKISARDKAKAIHDWVAGSVSYDVQKSVNLDFRADDSALKTLRTREGVCQDFSFLTIALARAAGLEARFIGGKTVEKGRINPNGHGWTEVKADGRWLVMDTTWDAGYIEGDRFVRDFSEKYFDPDPAEFARDHIREEIIY
ncbi:transglutaminase domain-containing protein [Phosphitispora fastidiosa]|uniref:transglutaminase domain-containing protein n=1 Tax=Phosphitispora fastidiosa TaxID=2837202 RepID=UPI001E478462|nr:hypothetical protein [Phosphitispora fastidiosa]